MDAIVNGRSEKKEVYFTKRYTSFQADAVFYRGVIEANTIKGNWDIEGSDGTLTGTFEMWRIGFLEKEKEQGQELEAARRTVSLSEHNVSKTMPTTSHTARVWKVNSN